jgi:hypothetical protein
MIFSALAITVLAEERIFSTSFVDTNKARLIVFTALNLALRRYR